MNEEKGIKRNQIKRLLGERTIRNISGSSTERKFEKMKR
jgi:hypothetical protein